MLFLHFFFQSNHPIAIHLFINLHLFPITANLLRHPSLLASLSISLHIISHPIIFKLSHSFTTHYMNITATLLFDFLSPVILAPIIFSITLNPGASFISNLYHFIFFWKSYILLTSIHSINFHPISITAKPLPHQSILHPPIQSFFFYLFHSHFTSSPIIIISFYHFIYLLSPHFCHFTFLIHPPYLPCATHPITEQIPGASLNLPSFFLIIFFTENMYRLCIFLCNFIHFYWLVHPCATIYPL